MKFSHSLQFNAVPEWSVKYLAYSNLKKLIYNLQREQLQRSAASRHTDEERSLISSTDSGDPQAVFLKALDAERIKIDEFYQSREDEIFKDLDILLDDVVEFEHNSSRVHERRRSSLLAPRKSSSKTSGLFVLPPADPENIDPLTPNTEGHHTEDTLGRLSRPDLREVASGDQLRNRSASPWDEDDEDEDSIIFKEPFNALSDLRITLKKRSINCFVSLSELKSFIQLNSTGFSKITKKFDKTLNTKLREKYLTALPTSTYIFSSDTKRNLETKVAQIINAYGKIATNGDDDAAKQELRLHLREHVVWDRNTVWRDMIGLERKAHAAAMKGVDGSDAILQGEESDITQDVAPIAWIKIGIYRIPIPSWLVGPTLRYLIVILLLVAIVWLFISPLLLDDVIQQNCLAILVLASCLWATETIPLFVTSLLIPFLIVLLKVLKNEDGTRMEAPDASKYIFSTMWNSVITLLLGGFTLAAALSKYQIAKKVSTWILSKAGTDPKVVLITICFVAAVVSMLVSNVAAPVLCYSIVQPLLRTLPKGSPFAKALVLGIALASDVGGMTSPIASPQNIIAIENMSPSPSWGQWFFVAIPVSIISIILIWFILLFSFKINKRNTILVSIRTIDEKFTFVQFYVCTVTLFTIILWCVSHQMEGLFGEMGVIALIPIICFFGTGLLTSEDFNNFLWTIIVLAMGGIALGKAVSNSGLLSVIALFIKGKVEHLSLFGVMSVFGLLIITTATFVSHTVAALIILPLVKEIGDNLPSADGVVHSNLLVMASALLCSVAMGLPTSGFPNLTAICMVDEVGRKYLTVKDFITRGVVGSLLAYAVVITVGYGLLCLIGF